MIATASSVPVSTSRMSFLRISLPPLAIGDEPGLETSGRRNDKKIELIY
jgi:hypothetical protein